MNSFIYNTPELLEKLLVIAQATPAISTGALNAAAKEIIRNLRTELSQFKAVANPTFTDIESLQNFKTWAVKNEAEAQGNRLVDESGRFNLTVLPKFLTDLRDKFASNPEFSESLANVIDQANKSLGIKIQLYPPVKTKTEEIPEVKDLNNKPGATNVSFKADESVVDPKTGKPTPSGTIMPQQQLANLIRSGGLSILDGTTVDFDHIYAEARDLTGFIGGNNVRASQMLGQVVIRINNITGNFSNLVQGKTPGLNTLGATPNEDAAKICNRIESTFNSGINQEMAKKHNQPLAYRYDELAEIAQYFARLMVEIITFYNMILTIPIFKSTPDIESVLRKQLEWATDYNTHFMGAHDRFMGDFARANKVR